jgi:hypothetical protein
VNRSPNLIVPFLGERCAGFFRGYRRGRRIGHAQMGVAEPAIKCSHDVDFDTWATMVPADPTGLRTGGDPSATFQVDTLIERPA